MTNSTQIISTHNQLVSNTYLSIRDILAHKSTMFNYKLPSDRTMYESSLIYCNLCDYSCDLTDKSAIICHYLAKHPDDNIVYSYLWPQMEHNQQTQTYKVKYYLIKAHLKIRTKEGGTSGGSSIDLSKLNYPNSLLNDDDKLNKSSENEEDDVGFVMGKLLDWLDKNLTEATTSISSTATQQITAQQTQEDVQELEEEQEVQEVEMFGEDTYESMLNTAQINTSNPQLDELVRMSSSASYYYNQQKLNATSSGLSLQLENQYLVHLLAINKIENVFRVKQIHDYYGGCFVCGKQVDFNMKHYQTHFNSELTTYICLHCNYKEYRQEAPPIIDKSTTSSGSKEHKLASNLSLDQTVCLNPIQLLKQQELYQIDTCDITQEEKQLQEHMTQCHNIDFNQILAQHQQLQQQQQQQTTNADASNGVVVIESTPMNDMYLSIQLKSIRYIDDDLLRKDDFKADMVYSCPICTGDTNVYNKSHLNPNLNNANSEQQAPYSNYENVTFEYLMNHFLNQHQFKAIPLFVCTICNCIRVSLIDCIYHYIRNHFNKKITIGLCAYNIYDKIQNQIAHLNQTSGLSSTGLSSSQSSSSSLSTSSHKTKGAASSNSSHHQLTSNPSNSQLLPVAATTSHTIYGSGPLIYCVTCNENYSNEPSFIRHSFLSHLLDPNINLNWYKVYAPIGSASKETQSSTQSLQQIAAAMAMADLTAAGGAVDGTVSLIDSNGQPITNIDQQLVLNYECPLCCKSVQTKDSINRHLLYHSINEHYEYDISCSSCTKQLSPSTNLAECLLHTREFRTHRLSINFHKYVLSQQEQSSGETVSSATPVPMVACVLCNNESTNLLSCTSHIMLDHFSYDSSTIKIKRFVNHMLNKMGLIPTSSDSTSALSTSLSPNTKAIKLNSNINKTIASKPPTQTGKVDNAELVQYFDEQFPTLTNEIVASLMAATKEVQQNSQSNVINNKPDIFFSDVKCFKCDKFSTKLKQSLFHHLNTQHQFELKDLEKLYETHIQRQLQLIDQQQLVEKYDRQQKEIFTHQQTLLKETKEKNEQQIQQQVQQQKQLVQQQHQQNQKQIQAQLQAAQVQAQVQAQAAQQQTVQVQAQPVQQANSNDIIIAAQDNAQIVPGSTTFLVQTANGSIVQATAVIAGNTVNVNTNNLNSLQEAALVNSNLGIALNSAQQVAAVEMPATQAQTVIQSAQPSQTNSTKSKSHHHHHQQHQTSNTSSDKIDSTIDQVLSKICSDTYDSEKQENMIVDTTHGYTNQQQITVSAQPPEAENLFVFKCNLCEPYTTDDATQLLEHYKLMHQVELTIADSSTLLAAAVAAFQTGHTIEMTGAILNTLSSVTDENGLTIISGEEVPVHTTVQYKCTICQMIFYEKQYICQHLYDAHNFQIDVSYFEEIELQQQEQLQQKIYEQQQEQLMLQQQQQLEQQQQQNTTQQNLNDKSGVGIADSSQHHHQNEQQEQNQTQEQSAQVANQPQTLIPVTNQNITDETAAVMMMMMNGTISTQSTNQTTTQTQQGGIILQANQVTDLNQIIAAGGQIIATPQGFDSNGTVTATAIPILNTSGITLSNAAVASPVVTKSEQQTTPKLAINYTCSYCTFGADKLKKMSDHLKQSHPFREKTCMDNIRQQVIRLPNEDLPPYNQNPPTVGTLLQQQAANQQQSALTSSLLSTTQALVNQTQSHEVAQQQLPVKQPYNGKKRGPKPKTSPNALNKSLNTQKQQQNATKPQPTILTMDANSQIIIDFNQNDDLLCSYCEYTINNLNYMRTHIKYKHKTQPITFQNKVTSRYYTIVEWPITPVPTLTPATTEQTSAQTESVQSSTITEQTQQSTVTSEAPNPSTNDTISSNLTPTNTTQTEISTSGTSAPSTPAPVITPSKPSKSAKENLDTSASSIRQKLNTPGSTTTAGGISINTNNVNTILKKLGVNLSSSSSPLSNLISSIGSGTKTVNNSVVNVNLNVLKDVNIDEMIDDDDDEERKFLIRELEKKANSKKQGVHPEKSEAKLKTESNGGGTGYNSDTGSATNTPGGVKRSRSNSSTNTQRAIKTELTPTSTNSVSHALGLSSVNTSSSQNQNLLSQLNITLNCHYCWAQFQLNVTKNLKNNIQQKENGKYMQHLSMHLNAPYKCNECSYPITDAKTFLKHKQFYKHDEKCIMVDNDITIPNSIANQINNNSTNPTRRKTLIATRLKQHQQNLLQQQEEQKQDKCENNTSIALLNQIQYHNDRDSFKCSLCYSDTDSAPSTSVSTLNKVPTTSNLGASNFSFDKEQVLKHVLIVHLSFLAYKCDTCAQFYAFDEPQTKQHAALVHHCTGSSNETQSCHFKLIKTEEEINLAINRAQQFITKIPAQAKKIDSSSPNSQIKTRQQSSTTPSSVSSNVSIEASPKYKCCKCNSSSQGGAIGITNSSNTPPATPSSPIVLYTYQDALDHVMNAHLTPSQNKKDKKLCYELELFEQNLEDLLASETGVITTISANSIHNNNNHLTCDDDDNEFDESNEDLGGELVDSQIDGDLTEWNVIFSEPSNIINSSSTSSSSQISPSLSGNRKKRFKTNQNTSISLPNSDSELSLFNTKKLKRFYFKPYLIFKCLLCSRKMNSFDIDHWIQHDRENHHKLYLTDGKPTTRPSFNYQQITCSKAISLNNQVGTTNTNQVTKTFESFTAFVKNYKSLEAPDQPTEPTYKLMSCLICGSDVKFTRIDVLKHFQSEHEFYIFDLGLQLDDLEIIHALQLNNQVSLCEGVHLRRRCFIKIPPPLINPTPNVDPNAITKIDLIDKEIKLLNDIFKEQIVEKQIVSWLNSEQFLRRNFNYNSYVCIICNQTKSNILETHYNLKKITSLSANTLALNNNGSVQPTETPANRLQYYTEEMKTVVLTNHILSHFNEYCYRCMSCKISWPDRTQLLKHTQECPNSQVVRTKTKYKLKANCRLQLKFYLQTYLDYWQHERCLETKNIEPLVPTVAKSNTSNKLECRVFIKDIILSKNLLLEASNRYNLNAINLEEGKKLILKEDDSVESKLQQESGQHAAKEDISMKDESEQEVTSTQ